MIANLMNNNLTQDEIAKLTWRTISDCYHHERDEYGGIVFPKEPAPVEPEGGWTFRDRFLGIQELRWGGMIGDVDYRRLIVELHTEFNEPLPSWWEKLPKLETPAPIPSASPVATVDAVKKKRERKKRSFGHG